MLSRYGFDSPRLCNTSRCDPAMRLRRRMSLSRYLAYYYEEEPGRRSAAKLLTKDEARHLRCLFKRAQETNGGLVVLKTLGKLIFGGAALAAATLFGTSTSRAYGEAHRERRRVFGLPVSLVRRLLPQRQYFGG